MKEVVIIEKLTKVVPNKYEAVRVIAKEARRINSILSKAAAGEVGHKPTSLALKRLLDNKIRYEFVEGEVQEAKFEDED